MIYQFYPKNTVGLLFFLLKDPFSTLFGSFMNQNII